MSTSTDGAPPSVEPTPEPPDAGAGTSSRSPWIHEEIRRRVQANGSRPRGRHARSDSADTPTPAPDPDYRPRHADPGPDPAQPGTPAQAQAATPAPARPPAQAPGPVGGPSLPPGGTSMRRSRLPGPGPADRGAPRAPMGGHRPAPDRAVDPRAPDPRAAEPRAAPDGPARRRSPAGNGADPRAGNRAAPRGGAPNLTGPDAQARNGAASAPDRPAVEVPVRRSAEDADRSTVQRAGRVRVVIAEGKRKARPVRVINEVQEGTPLGKLLRKELIGSQLTVALRFAAVAGLTLGLLPLLFAVFPEIGRWEVFGLRLPWLVLGVAVYPFLLVLGWWHARTAERVEQTFTEHVQD